MKAFRFDSSPAISSPISMIFVVALALWLVLFAFRESRKMIAEMKYLSEQNVIILDHAPRSSVKTPK